MTVGELIGILIKFDQDAVVKAWDYNPGEGWFRATVEDAHHYIEDNGVPVNEVVIT